MPITFAHPAFVLPFVRLRRESGWLGGLVAGSVAPDILQSLYGTIDRSPHSFLGWIALDTPFAVALTWFAHRAITPRLRRMPGLETIRPSTSFAWTWAAVAALLASAFHLMVDLFTHGESPLAQTGILAFSLGGPEWDPFMVSYLLWYLGSILGTMATLGWLAHRAWKVPGGWGRFVCWQWIVVVVSCSIPLVPILHFVRLIYNPDLLEFLSRFKYLAGIVRMALFGSAFLGFATLYMVTWKSVNRVADKLPDPPGRDDQCEISA